MQDLTLALVQTDIVWQNPDANRKMLGDKIRNLNKSVDVVMLPEMFTTGFTMDVKGNAEPPNGITLEWMKQLASETKAVLTGSIIVEENGKFFNRLYWVEPNRQVNSYDKRHLFRMADEEKYFSGGDKSPVMEVKGWKVKPLICYDLRFPVWSRNVALEYDILLYVANWPKARVEAWDTLLKARAIENLCYSIGVNRVGADGVEIIYNGQSACYNFKGESLLEKSANEEIYLIRVSKKELEEYRTKFPAHLDSDTFKILK
ncbi:MAG: amidohydrolase [Cyclobacteriaceae bacterium]|nr:amidohydrolase [Cyclobacteriaceae bacterium]